MESSDSQSSPLQSPLRGIAFALAGFGLLSVGDAIVKSNNGGWPGPAFALLRYVFAVVGLTAWIWFKQGRAGFVCPKPWVQFGRGVCIGFSAGCFFAGLQFLPLAEMTVIQFTSPMIVGILSAFILKEPARLPVWVSSFVAMIGVLLVVRPTGSGFGWAALLPIGSACGMAMMMVFNRMVAGQASALQMQWLISVFAMPVLLVFAGATHLSGIPAFHVGFPAQIIVIKAALIAVSATAAHGLIYLATTRASAAQTAPAIYVQLLVALILGYFLFGAVPDAIALAGAVLIIGSGLYLWRSASAK